MALDRRNHGALLTAPAIAAALATILGLAQPASARGWTATGAGGRTVSHTVTPYNNGGGDFGRTATTTGPNGNTASRTYSHSVNDGTITNTRTATGFGGESAAATVSRTPGAGGSAAYVGPAGRTFTGSYAP